MLISLFFLLSCLCGSLADSNPFRLPTTVVPKLYNLSITTNLGQNLTFSGTVEININISLSEIVQKDLFNISLNKGPELFVNETTTTLVFTLGDKKVTPIKTFYNNDTEVYTLQFSLNGTNINVTETEYAMAWLTLNFYGNLRRDMRGYYLSAYKLDSGFVVNTAVTQFESTDARQAFPCWDEPSFKAVFQVTLIGPSSLQMLSNMNQLSRSPTEGNCSYRRQDGKDDQSCDIAKFNPSEPMSTYLVAFMVGEYNVLTSKDLGLNGSVPTNVVYPLTYEQKDAEWALRNAYNILPYYETLFKVPYPLPKMDHAAIFDFAAGAMENWGLITYRSTDLMANEDDESEASLKNVVVVVAHELAHQWFGDLVTMEWWNDLWLNEGFASFVENLGVDYVQPQYQIWNDFIITVSSALDLDVSQYTHAIQQPVSDPKEIDQLFDVITYNKGSAVLRMLYEFMGADNFMKGINAYLTKYKYSNAQSYQLWEVLSSYSDYNITSIMNTWLLNPGFPLVIVNTSNKEITLTQTRMLKGGPSGTENAGSGLWKIPITIETSERTLSPQLMTNRSEKVALNTTELDYFVINANFNNYYRVLYDEESFGMIESAFVNIGQVNQYNVLSDRFALAMNNYVDTKKYLFFFKRVLDNTTDQAKLHPKQISYLVWSELIANALAIDDLFCEYGYSNDYLSETSDTKNDSQILTSFRNFTVGYLQTMYDIVGGYNSSVMSDNNNITNIRPQIILALIQMGDSRAIQDGENLYNSQVASNGNNNNYSLNSLDPNLITCVLSAALATNNEDYYNQITGPLYQSVDSTQQDYILSSLGALYGDQDLITKGIDFVLSKSVRDNAKIRGLYSCRRCKGRFSVWSELSANDGEAWDNLAAVFGSGFAMSDLTAVFNTFASQTMLDNVKQFYNTNGRTTSANARVVNQTLESIDSRQSWLQDNRGKVQQFLIAVGVYPKNNNNNNNNGGNSSGGGGGSSDHWYKEWWFILIVVLIALALIAGVIYGILRQRKRRGGDEYLKISERGH